MSYLAKRLSSDFDNVKLIKMISGKSKFKKVLNLFYIFLIALLLKCKTTNNDYIFLMEYLARSCFQDKLARIIKFLGVKGVTIGLVHLAASHLMEIYHSTDVIKRKMDAIDKCVVFGSSLAYFFKKEVGYKNVITTFHYVDTSYYKPKNESRKELPLRVLCLGNIKRDFSALRNLINRLPNIHFDICQGVMNLHAYFDDCSNVSLYGFVSESELLELMQSNDVCLSIMTDTVGSNVITTSLATGLILVVSDVGSIRDYCTEDSSFLCNNIIDFEKSIKYLSDNLQLINEYRQKSVSRGMLFSYDNFRNEFLKIFS